MNASSIHLFSRFALVLSLVIPAASAQNASVPPPRGTAAEAVSEAASSFGQSVQTGANAADATRWGLESARNLGGTARDAVGATRDTVQRARSVSRVSGGAAQAVSGVTYGIEIYRGCRLGPQQCYDAELSVLGDIARDKTLEGLGYLVPGPARPAYWGSVAVGNLARSWPIGESPSGDIRTFGDATDDFTWKHLAEPIHNRITTGYFDPLADDVINRKIELKRQELRARARAMQAANEQAALQTRQSDPPPIASSGGGFLRGSVETGFHPTPPFVLMPPTSRFPVPSSQGQQTTTSRAQACTPARKLDPKTGCHSGHDEKSHPGGCKCESGSIPR